MRRAARARGAIGRAARNRGPAGDSIDRPDAQLGGRPDQPPGCEEAACAARRATGSDGTAAGGICGSSGAPVSLRPRPRPRNAGGRDGHRPAGGAANAAQLGCGGLAAIVPAARQAQRARGDRAIAGAASARDARRSGTRRALLAGGVARAARCCGGGRRQRLARNAAGRSAGSARPGPAPDHDNAPRPVGGGSVRHGNCRTGDAGPALGDIHPLDSAARRAPCGARAIRILLVGQEWAGTRRSCGDARPAAAASLGPGARHAARAAGRRKPARYEPGASPAAPVRTAAARAPFIRGQGRIAPNIPPSIAARRGYASRQRKPRILCERSARSCGKPRTIETGPVARAKMATCGWRH